MKIITKMIMLTTTFSIPYYTGGSNQIKKKDAEAKLNEIKPDDVLQQYKTGSFLKQFLSEQ